MPLTLVRAGRTEGVNGPGRVDIPAKRTVLVGFRLRDPKKPAPAQARFPFRVSNFLVAPGKGLETSITLPVV